MIRPRRTSLAVDTDMVPDSPDVISSTLARYEALVRVSAALRTYHRRDVLVRSLAQELRPVVPFGFLGLALFDEETRRVEPHVLEATGEQAPPPELTSEEQLTYWVIEHQSPLVIADVARETRFEQEMKYLRRQGAVSVCCLPLTTPRRRVGMLLVGSRESGVYADGEVAFLALVANQVALAIDDAISHDALEASLALARERLRALDTSDALLRAISPALDVRQVFRQVSEIARQVIPHDLVSLLLVTDDRTQIVVHAISADDMSFPRTIPIPEHHRHLLESSWDYVIDPDIQAHPVERQTPPGKAGYRARLLMPVRLADQGFGALDFLSRQVNLYTSDDALVARRIAEHVAMALSHQRLAERAREGDELRAREGRLELLDELLAGATDTGELRDQFARISEIAAKVLPHDAMSLPVMLPDGVHARVYAYTGVAPAAGPEIIRVPEDIVRGDRDHVLIDEMDGTPGSLDERAVARGFRSSLRVAIRFDGRMAGGLVFFSRRPSAYTAGDVMIARRIAGRVALALSRELREEESARADQAQQRAGALEARVNALAAELNAVTGYRWVIGQSQPWTRVLKQATQVAGTDTTTLLLGESGTGKEVVARFIHRASARSGGPFVALNCAALPEPLLESELFGFERGAFTGALQAKPGQIEQAAGGVLFLDEVGEMSLPVQAKFLRVLQEREFQRLGGTRTLKANVRVVAATNRNLRAAIERGGFREDLYYRLNVFEIRLPPLRERRDDILPLSEAFLKEIAKAFGRPPAGIARDARDGLMSYGWPGNVRELRNVLERAAILCEGGLITTEHLTFASVDGHGQDVPRADLATPAASDTTDLRIIEKATIERALLDARHNKSQAAKKLGLTRKQLYVRLRQHGLE